MIRHRRRGGLLTQPILSLPVTMIESPFFTALMPPIRTAKLVAARLLAARRAAIAMATITVRADEKDGVAMLPAARSLQETRLIMGYRRHRRRAEVDNGSPVMSG
jgi:hypothetical protein